MKKKNPHRAQIFRYFRIESRNNEAYWITVFIKNEQEKTF